MTYNAVEYWENAGKNPDAIDHESRFVHSDVFAEQERRLMATLETLTFGSVLEVGCGFGRITRVVAERWPEVAYTAIDLSAERLESARDKAPGVEYVQTAIQSYRTRRKWDLVLAVETLMHVPGEDIEVVVERLDGLSRRWIVSLDWTESLPPGTVIASWNARFNYPALYGSRLVSAERVGPLQSVFVADVRL